MAIDQKSADSRHTRYIRDVFGESPFIEAIVWPHWCDGRSVNAVEGIGRGHGGSV